MSGSSSVGPSEREKVEVDETEDYRAARAADVPPLAGLGARLATRVMWLTGVAFVLVIVVPPDWCRWGGVGEPGEVLDWKKDIIGRLLATMGPILASLLGYVFGRRSVEA